METTNLLKLFTLQIIIKVLCVIIEPTYSSNSNIRV
jgi:hypothetical protein